jgi:hypothetical protein
MKANNYQGPQRRPGHQGQSTAPKAATSMRSRNPFSLSSPYNSFGLCRLFGRRSPWRPLPPTQLRFRKAKTPTNLKDYPQPFQINFPRLLGELKKQFSEGERLTAVVWERLMGVQQ